MKDETVQDETVQDETVQDQTVHHNAADEPTPILPAYGRGCLTDLLPPLLGLGDPDLPTLAINGRGDGAALSLDDRAPTVLLVLDGLGWDQLVERRALTPTLSGLPGGPITSVAPSTTATALTSITTALTPGEHGIVGYRMVVDGEVLNCLRWGTKGRPDGRRVWPPSSLQPYEPFLGQRVDMVNKAEFRTSGFSGAHLRGADLHGYRTTAVMVHEIGQLIREGTPFVYAYYDGVDKVSHEHGLGGAFDAEVAFADRLVADVVAAVPEGTQVVITADHGQVDCRNGLIDVGAEVRQLIDGFSGEARFRWLHCHDRRVDQLLAAATEGHGHHAWVRSIEQILDEGWFGRSMRAEVIDRLGQVALCPFEPIGFDDPDDGGPFPLVGRHGSLTEAEMLVPLLGAVA